MGGYDYVSSVVHHSVDWTASLNLSSGSTVPKNYSGRYAQEYKSPNGTLYLYSNWENGKLDGRAILRNAYGEDLMILPFRAGLLSGIAVCQTQSTIYNVEFFQNRPTGCVTFTDVSTSERYSCKYTRSNEVTSVNSSGNRTFPVMKIMDQVGNAPPPVFKRHVEPVDPSVIKKCNATEYCNAFSNYLWYNSMAAVYTRRGAKSSDYDSAMGHVQGAADIMHDIESCVESSVEMDRRIAAIRRQYNTQTIASQKKAEKREQKYIQTAAKCRETTNAWVTELIRTQKKKGAEEEKQKKTIAKILEERRNHDKQLREEMLFHARLGYMEASSRAQVIEERRRREEEERLRKLREEEERLRKLREEEERKRREEEEREEEALRIIGMEVSEMMWYRLIEYMEKNGFMSVMGIMNEEERIKLIEDLYWQAFKSYEGNLQGLIMEVKARGWMDLQEQEVMNRLGVEIWNSILERIDWNKNEEQMKINEEEEKERLRLIKELEEEERLEKLQEEKQKSKQDTRKDKKKKKKEAKKLKQEEAKKKAKEAEEEAKKKAAEAWKEKERMLAQLAEENARRRSGEEEKQRKLEEEEWRIADEKARMELEKQEAKKRAAMEAALNRERRKGGNLHAESKEEKKPKRVVMNEGEGDIKKEEEKENDNRNQYMQTPTQLHEQTGGTNGRRQIIDIDGTDDLMDYSPRMEQMDSLTPTRGALKKELKKDNVVINSKIRDKLKNKKQ